MSPKPEFENFEDLCEFFVKQVPHRIDDATRDHILIGEFFTKVRDKEKQTDISEAQVESFKANFPYEAYGLDNKKMQEKLKNYRSVRRVIDEIVASIPKETKENIMRQHLKEFWLDRHHEGNFKSLVDNLNPQFWFEAQ